MRFLDIFLSLGVRHPQKFFLWGRRLHTGWQGSVALLTPVRPASIPFALIDKFSLGSPRAPTRSGKWYNMTPSRRLGRSPGGLRALTRDWVVDRCLFLCFSALFRFCPLFSC